MNLPKESFGLRKVCLYLLFFLFISLFSATYSFAQNTGIPDNPIDANALKNANPSELQDYLKDKNQDKKAGEDVHKKINDENAYASYRDHYPGTHDKYAAAREDLQGGERKAAAGVSYRPAAAGRL